MQAAYVIVCWYELRLPGSCRVPLYRRSQVWEGGLGGKDKAHLESRDSHKHTISKLKTQSKRSERVGQRGKQLREQRQAARVD